MVRLLTYHFYQISFHLIIVLLAQKRNIPNRRSTANMEILLPAFPQPRNAKAMEDKTTVLTLKMANGFPFRPGCDTAPAQSIYMDLGVRMDGYGSPPPFILTSCGKLQEYASWSTFTDHEAYLFVIPSIGIKCKLSGFS